MGIRDYYQHGGQKKWPLSRLAIQELDKALSRPPGVSEAEFFDKYCPPLPPNYEVPCEELSASLPDKAADGYFIIWSRQNWDDRQWRLHRWAYARLTEFVDRQIGQILDALRDAGLEDKTVVAMTSDHGDQDASHRLEHKGFLYEESPHIPLILRYRGVVKAGQVDQEHLVSNGTDLLPTLCDLAGLPVSATYPGRSIRPLSEGRDVADWRKSLIVETRFARLVHMGRWKYMVGIDPQQTPEKYKPFFPQTNVREVLVDLEKDPGEMNNRASEPACAAILRRGRQWLQEGYAAMRRNAEEKYMVKE
jgi:choline-sulfatase